MDLSWTQPLFLSCLAAAAALGGIALIAASCGCCMMLHEQRLRKIEQSTLPRRYSDSSVYIPCSEDEDDGPLKNVSHGV
jgi:hypothetical protein